MTRSTSTRVINSLKTQLAELEAENKALQSVCGAFTTEENWRDPVWLSEQIGESVSEAKVEQITGHGGAIAGLHRVSMTSNGEIKTAIIKTTQSVEPEILGRAASMGLPREAFFFNSFAERLQPELQVPKTWYAHGDLTKGTKVLLMEDLSACAQAGHFFGPTNPFNGGKDLDALTKGKGFNFSGEQIAEAAFDQAAVLHAKFWGDESLIGLPFLKGSGWKQGRDKESWDKWQAQAAGAWAKTKAKIASGKSTVKWDEVLVKVIDASIAKASWSAFQAQLSKRSFTFVHGDFHPGNIMIRPPTGESSKPSLVLIDFEAVSIGCGPAEIAQLVISHMAPDARRACEDRLLDVYYNRLTSLLPADQTYSTEQFKADYIGAGTARWVWLTAVMSAMLPDFMNQVFNDQLAAFVHDHGVTPDNVEMPC